MAKVTLAPFIESISGKVGNLQFRTLKSGRTVVHARRCTTEDGIRHRTTPPTPAEIAHRKRFGMVSSITAEIQSLYPRIDQAAADRKLIWQRVAYHYDKLRPSIEDDKQLKQEILSRLTAKNSATKTGF